jgi:DNA-binding winged helix-turn-helix (wHTH) protein
MDVQNAVLQNDIEALRKLFRKGKWRKSYLTTNDQEGLTPMATAIKHNHLVRRSKKIATTATTTTTTTKKKKKKKQKKTKKKKKKKKAQCDHFCQTKFFCMCISFASCGCSRRENK